MPISDRILSFVRRHERVFMFGSSACGFAFDLIIAKRPDSLFVNILLVSYLVISAAIIAHLHTPSRRAGEKSAKQTLVFLLILTFCLGGLASNLLILYGKSGTASGDILFLGMLAAMLVGNEFVRDRYEQFHVNIATWYTLLLTYCVIAVPTFILHTVGPREFLFSGGVSIAVAAGFLLLLDKTVKLFRGDEGRELLLHASLIITGILGFFNVLYFSGIIPPVPLALKQVGIYHEVLRADTGYTVLLEPAPWWEFWRDTNPVFHPGASNYLYCFSSVFAPAGLATPVMHRFERYDTKTQSWETATVVVFPITGGRAEGYRGYSIITTPPPGKWRCNVETTAGDLIGRTEFTVAPSSTPPQLVQKVL